MEKRTEWSGPEIVRIVITGPECTGKSTLTEQLASHFGASHIPEYAREYIGNLCRPYTYEDVTHIAETQRQQAYETVNPFSKIIFLDTYLIITKIWFEIVFKRYPEWIDKELSAKTIGLYLLCDTSIPWTADGVRENGGEMREKLFERYRSELERLGCTYSVITGTGQERLNCAIRAVKRYLENYIRLES